MTPPRYLLAKYVPDLRRFEPHNIGVIVWSPDALEARFIGEKADAPGVVDGRRAPSFIRDLDAYRGWIQYWREEMKRSFIKTRDGNTVAKTDAAYLQTLAGTGAGKFLLAEAGFLLDEPDSDGVLRLTDYLFGLLVDKQEDTVTEDDAKDVGLDGLCEQLFEQSDLANDPHLIKNYATNCTVGSLTERFEFSFAYKNGSLKRIFQKVPLWTKGNTLLKNIHHPMWMLHRMVEAKTLKRDQCATVVNVDATRIGDLEVRNAVAKLESVGRVINVADWKAAVGEMASLKASH